MLAPVPPALEGERADRALALLVGISRAAAAQMIANGHASIDGALLTNGSRRLRKGELLAADLSILAPGPGSGQAPPDGPREAVAVPIVYADDEVIVVDKPAGLVVHPGAGNLTGTLVQELLRVFPDLASAGPEGARPGIVHRLDKGTSGLLVVARNAASREALVRQMASRATERRYLALVHGVVDEDEGIIDAPLARSPAKRLTMAVVQGGRAARTRYWARARSASVLPATLVSCRLETGRTHQLRAHFAAIRHPVVGDDRYTPAQLAAATSKALPQLSRPWLHAAQLGFHHPATGEMMRFSSPLPGDLSESLAALGFPAGSAVV